MKKPLQSLFRTERFIFRRLLSDKVSRMEMAYGKTYSFAQFGEDLFIDNYFDMKDAGCYIDVGAFHPFNISNTYMFYKRG